jgi:hypothetical protein
MPTYAGTTPAKAGELSASMRALLWFFVILIALILIAVLIAWIVESNNPNRNDRKYRKIHTRELDVTHDVEVQGNINVCDGVYSKASVISHLLALKPKENSNSTISMNGKHSFLVLTSSTSTPVNVNLPLGSGVPDGMLVLIVNQSVATSFNVMASGSDTLNGGTGLVTVSSSLSGLFYCTGTLSNSSARSWVQLKF